MLKESLPEFKLKKEFEGKTATWQHPCHLVRYQNIKDQPRPPKGLRKRFYTWIC